MHETERQLVGTWFATPVDGQGAPRYLRVTGDLRFLEFVDDPLKESEPKYWMILLWFSAEEDGLIRLRPRQDHPGWTRRILFDGDTVMISNSRSDPPLSWKCVRVDAAEIPDWFEERCAEALERPWL